MIAALSVLTPPTGRLVTPDICRRHLRVDQQFDDSLISMYLTAATEIASNYLNKALLTQTLNFTLGRAFHGGVNSNNVQYESAYGINWCNGYNTFRTIKLPRSPVQSVATVIRGHWGQPDYTLTEGVEYDVDLETTPGRIIFYDEYYTPFSFRDHISITYTAGFGDTASSVPPQIIHAVLLILTGIYFNRGDDQNEIMPRAACHLLDSFVELQFGGFEDR